MDFQFSTNQNGPFNLSPPQLHNMNAISELRKLRRSISRSPSKKSPRFQSASHSSLSPTCHFVGSSSSEMQPNPSPYNDHENRDQDAAQSRKVRSALPRSTPIKGMFRTTRSQSGSPMRRALASLNDNGNSNSACIQMLDGQENAGDPIVGSDTKLLGLMQSQKVSDRLEGSFQDAWAHPGRVRHSERFSDGNFSKSSPLKRSDAARLSDQSNYGSPSKRRSLNGPPPGFNHQFPDGPHTGPLDFDHMEDEHSNMPADGQTESSSLLWQQNASSSFSERIESLPNHRHSLDITVNGFAVSRNRLDSYLTNPVANTLFSETKVSAARPSFTTPIKEARRSLQTRPTRNNPHPLSRTVNPTSPTFASEQPDSMVTDMPPQSPQQHRVPAFSKSLPIGAIRPQAQPMNPDGYIFAQLQGTSMATPDLHRLARPDPAAFRSTGLISKRHRNPDDLPPPNMNPGMPDTPCKRNPSTTAFSSSPTSAQSIAKPRFYEYDQETPSKHTNPQNGCADPSGYSARGSTPTDHQLSQHRGRRQSNASLYDTEDNCQSPGRPSESQSSADELPPTPTKRTGLTTDIKSQSLRSSILGRRPAIVQGTFMSPPAHEAHDAPGNNINTSEHPPPQTPTSSLIPDSGFLFSTRTFGQDPKSPCSNESFSPKVNAPPETPTVIREIEISHQPQIRNRTPIHNQLPVHEADSFLVSRFKRVESYRKGEFSHVFKVYQSSEPITCQSYFSRSSRHRQLHTCLPDKVWIVKKSKAPLNSTKDRQRKLREVAIMKALGQSDHIVQLIDSFEANNYLYIQTEFCEEGSLEEFLTLQGGKGRLDDFRIWKIFIELSQGVQHIHHSGFIHLDLKPANVFIDFEGVLKIGDFGLASEWPAPANVEGEGDRRYMGPDLLQGHLDKPADIFALGMIMYEIAGNFIPPDNGASWHQLRSGDFSELPSLTSGSSPSLGHNSQDRFVTKLSSDNIDPSYTVQVLHPSPDQVASLEETFSPFATFAEDDACISGTRSLAHPPRFMLDPDDAQSLDCVVRWMMLPQASERPVVHQLLELDGCRWVEERRRSGAIVWEGKWGPPEPSSQEKAPQEDEEMLDAPGFLPQEIGLVSQQIN